MSFQENARRFVPRIRLIRHKPLMFSFVCLAGISVWLGCTQPLTAELEQALTLYQQNQLSEALPLFEQAVAKAQDNAAAHAWLAETYRRLGNKDEALKAARRAIALDPCNSFAHTVLADAYNPIYGDWESSNSDSTWTHLQKAVACDSTDGNAWVSIWSEAIRRGERSFAARALPTAFRTGFFAKAALAYNRWMLHGLPENALLVTNGDMDTYPAVALQEVEGFRADVAVVNRSLLNTNWYARYIGDHNNLPLPFDDAELESLRAFKDEQGNVITPSDQILKALIEQKARGEFLRPIAFSVTVEPSFTNTIKDHLQMAGPFLLWQTTSAAATPDTAMLRRNLANIDSEDFAGSFASPKDRSSVRQAYTNGIVRNVTATAVTYSDLLIKAGNFVEAQKWLNWAEAFEKNTELGPAFTKLIDILKEAAKSGRENNEKQP